jgi:hypothetical protein
MEDRSVITLHEIADLLVSHEAEQLCCGNYLNRRGVRGYYLQVKCGNHWCKVSVSHVERHSARLTVEELDGLNPEMLSAVMVAIPTTSISSALRSGEAEQAPIERYVNSSAVEGIWSEFYRDGNWYMVSLSQVEVPAYASRNELERIADDFLSQQVGRMGHRRRRIDER